MSIHAKNYDFWEHIVVSFVGNGFLTVWTCPKNKYIRPIIITARAPIPVVVLISQMRLGFEAWGLGDLREVRLGYEAAGTAIMTVLCGDQNIIIRPDYSITLTLIAFTAARNIEFDLYYENLVKDETFEPQARDVRIVEQPIKTKPRLWLW